MRKYIKKFVGDCIPCITCRKPTSKRRVQLYPIEKVAKPFQKLHLDHLGPFCKTLGENTHILVNIDASTKFVWLQTCSQEANKFVR